MLRRNVHRFGVASVLHHPRVFAMTTISQRSFARKTLHSELLSQIADPEERKYYENNP